jgi:aromatic-L-amino-acid/L-tryptophan decarboxylase
MANLIRLAVASGELIAIAPANAYRVLGTERPNSVALDPHKWLHAPFEAGCAFVRGGSAHRNTFTARHR